MSLASIRSCFAPATSCGSRRFLGRSSTRVIVRVKKPGLLMTVQDRGRWGYQAMGVPVAGPMDEYSHRLANALVGNEDAAATLEVTLAGPDLEFVDERAVAVTGARFENVPNGVVRVR